MAEKLEPYQANAAKAMLEVINKPQYEADLEDSSARNKVSEIVLSAAHNGLALTDETLDYSIELLGQRHGITPPQFDDLVGEDLALQTPEDAEDRVRVVHVALELMRTEEELTAKSPISADSPVDRTGPITAEELEFDERRLAEVILSRGGRKANLEQDQNGADSAEDISLIELAGIEDDLGQPDDASKQLNELFGIRHMVDLVHRIEALSENKLDSEEILELASDYKQFAQALERQRSLDEETPLPGDVAAETPIETVDRLRNKDLVDGFDNFEDILDNEHREGLGLVMLYEATEAQIENFFAHKREGFIPKLHNVEIKEN